MSEGVPKPEQIFLPAFVQKALKNILEPIFATGALVEVQQQAGGFDITISITYGDILPAQIDEIIANLPQEDVTYTQVEQMGEIIITPKKPKLN